ncbi:ADP-ribosylglycohydrolase [Alteromonas sp. KUL106]|uniref:GFA family protein n=1 Tax=Alteromonas sp. KUL106 TaxID=2480799 RepID=UPI0012E59DA2|nr:ADP-ribosylglycohydrolase [Alteromonas sp. KUL106]GFD67028.1 hypothetical protein KUL106_02910 [Alteromonas sp. KUL106]
MFRGSCSCQSIQYEVDHISELEADSETLSQADASAFRVRISKKALVIDCAPSTLAALHEANGETHHVCNLCGSIVYIEDTSRNVVVEVNYSGHDVLAETHGQFIL